VRDLARKRMQMVQCCTAQVLAVENIMARQLGGRMTSNQIKRLTDDAIDQMPLAADVRLAIKTNIAVIATLQSQIEMLEKRLQECVKRSHQGIGAQTGARLLSHPEGRQTVRRNAMLCLRDDDDPANHVR
jgi:hypothetical protein